ncbi:MAG: cytoplasmic protein [Syntrophales bacterium]
MQYERVDVECYSGHKVNECPLAFTFRGNRLEITKIIDRWYQGNPDSRQPTLDYFKVRTAAGEEYILRYNALFDAWSILIP